MFLYNLQVDNSGYWVGMLIFSPVFVCSILSPEWVCGLMPFPAIYKQQFSFTVITTEFDMRSASDSLCGLTSFQCLISILNPVLFIFYHQLSSHLFVMLRGFLSFSTTLCSCLVNSTPLYIYVCVYKYVCLFTDITLLLLWHNTLYINWSFVSRR